MKNQCKPIFRGKWMALLLSVLLLMGMLPMPGGAAEAGSLTVKLTADTYDRLPKDPAVEVTLYQIGEADGSAKSGWRIYDDFRYYGIIEAKTPSDLGSIAAKLENDIAGKPQYKGTTKALSNGQARFSIDEYGVYFGMLASGPKGLEVQPFIVTVPSRDPETKQLRENYDVVLKDSCVTSVTVEKVWKDSDNQDGKRPKFIDVTLSNGKKVTLNDANGWKATVDSLPIYEKGKEIKYTWTEAKVDGYTSTQVTNGQITTLTNVHTPETTEVTVKKVWSDADDQDAKRPDHIDVTLSNGQKVTLNDANQWTATISNLPKYAGGKEIAYTWTEAKVDGYTPTQVTNGQITTLTNVHKPEETEVTVKKVWDDADDRDGKRPDHIDVTLSSGQTVTLNDANQWTATVTGLPKYANGQEIAYTWIEAKVDGYTSTQVTDGQITTLTNVHTPEETEATVKKVWNDADNQDGKRPGSIEVTLSNGQQRPEGDAERFQPVDRDHHGPAEVRERPGDRLHLDRGEGGRLHVHAGDGWHDHHADQLPHARGDRSDGQEGLERRGRPGSHPSGPHRRDAVRRPDRDAERGQPVDRDDHGPAEVRERQGDHLHLDRGGGGRLCVHAGDGRHDHHADQLPHARQSAADRYQRIEDLGGR